MTLGLYLARALARIARWRRREALAPKTEERTHVSRSEIRSPFVMKAAALRFGDLLLHGNAYRRVDRVDFENEHVHVRFAGGLEHSYRLYDLVAVNAP
jgi:hypothetical protein